MEEMGGGTMDDSKLHDEDNGEEETKEKKKKRKRNEMEDRKSRVGKECLRLCRSRWSPYH